MQARSPDGVCAARLNAHCPLLPCFRKCYNDGMEITVNGNRTTLDDGSTVRNLLERLALTGKFVAVERNREVVPYQTFDHAVLENGDTLEIVTLVGGG